MAFGCNQCSWTYRKNSWAALRTDAELLKSSSRNMASFPVSSFKTLMASIALFLLLEAM